MFVYHVILLTAKGGTVGPDGPAYINGTLIFNPKKTYQVNAAQRMYNRYKILFFFFQVWRFITYMFVHSGYFHIVFNILIQVG